MLPIKDLLMLKIGMGVFCSILNSLPIKDIMLLNSIMDFVWRRASVFRLI
jgi:hypothetical protein